MRLSRCGAVVEDNELAIREAVDDMLRRCDVVEPPTPLEDILRFRRLTAEERDEFIAHQHLLPVALRRKLHRAKSRVRGLLDLQSRQMIVDRGLHPHRRLFIKHHEVGHDVLPWHRELFVVTSELDLRPDVRRVFEAEANRFAALTIFQGDDLAKWQRGRRLRVEDLAGLAARYDASLTATARQYVSVQDLPAALLVGAPEATAHGARGIRFRYGMANAAFLREFSSRVFDDALPATAATCTVVNAPMPPIAREEFTVADRNGDRRTLLTETMYNGYDTLTLVHVEARRARVFSFLSLPKRRTRATSRR